MGILRCAVGAVGLGLETFDTFAQVYNEFGERSDQAGLG